MHTATALGDRIKTIRGELNQEEFAQLLGVNRNTLRAYERGVNQPNAEFLAILSSKFYANPAWILLGEGPMLRGGADGQTAPAPLVSTACEPEIVMIPKVKARLSAGGGSLETGDEVVGLYAFRTEFVKRKGNAREMVLMDVSGDSMEPEIKSGDTLLIDQSQRKIIAGCIYAVGMDEEVVVKVLEKAPGKLILRSYNTLFPAIEIDMRGDLSDGVRIIGRVIWWCREAR